MLFLKWAQHGMDEFALLPEGSKDRVWDKLVIPARFVKCRLPTRADIRAFGQRNRWTAHIPDSMIGVRVMVARAGFSDWDATAAVALEENVEERVDPRLQLQRYAEGFVSFLKVRSSWNLRRMRDDYVSRGWFIVVGQYGPQAWEICAGLAIRKSGIDGKPGFRAQVPVAFRSHWPVCRCD